MTCKVKIAEGEFLSFEVGKAHGFCGMTIPYAWYRQASNSVANGYYQFDSAPVESASRSPIDIIKAICKRVREYRCGTIYMADNRLGRLSKYVFLPLKNQELEPWTDDGLEYVPTLSEWYTNLNTNHKVRDLYIRVKKIPKPRKPRAKKEAK